MSDLPEPKSRQELYEYKAAGGDYEGTLPNPKSREELYLKTIAEQGGGGGGTSNYNQLSNKPKINNVELSGNKTTEDLIPIGDGLDFDVNGKLITTGGGSGAVDSVNGKTGVVVLDADDVGALPDDTNIPDSTSDLTNDSGFITSTVNNLVNYYLKSETYTQAEVNTLISAIVTLDIRAVSTLPTENISRTTIYLVPSADPQAQNIKDEYINLDGTSSGWELIGSTEIDLTGYVTDTELTTALANYTTTANLTTLLANKADASDVDDIEALIPSTATTSNKLATMGDVIDDFDDLNNRPLESEPINIDDLDLPMPSVGQNYPVLFDETGSEYQVGWYKRSSDGKVKPIYRKDIIYNGSLTLNNAAQNTELADLTSLNIDSFLYYIGRFKWGNVGIRTIPMSVDSVNASLVCGFDSNKLNMDYYRGTGTITISDISITIYFTKTTDTWKSLS